MFKYKSLIVLLLVLVACDVPDSKKLLHEEECVVEDHKHVMFETDSILILADVEFEWMKQNKIDQNMFVDSLETDLVDKLIAIKGIKDELYVVEGNAVRQAELTKQELDAALLKCKKTEEKLKALSEDFALEIGFYVDLEAATKASCNVEINALHKIIDSLKSPVLDTIIVNKRRNKKRKLK